MKAQVVPQCSTSSQDSHPGHLLLITWNRVVTSPTPKIARTDRSIGGVIEEHRPTGIIPPSQVWPGALQIEVGEWDVITL